MAEPIPGFNLSLSFSQLDQPPTMRNVPDVSDQLSAQQESPKKQKFKEEQLASVNCEKSFGSIGLAYEFQGKKKRVKADPKETIFEVLKRNHGEIKDETEFLHVSVRESGAVIHPWVPCGAVKKLEILDVTIYNIRPPEPSVYPHYSDLQCFTVNSPKKNRDGFRVYLHNKKYSDNKPLLVFGHKDESIKEAMERDTRFDVTSELVIKKEKFPPYLSIYSEKLGAELNSSVPCGALGEGKNLKVSIRKSKPSESYKYPVYSDGVFFKLEKSTNLKSSLHEKHYYSKRPLAVYGSKDQSIRDALTNDKRFNISGEFFLRHSGEADCSSELPLSQLNPDHFYVIYQDKSPKAASKTPDVRDSETSHDQELNSPNLSQTDFEETPRNCRTRPIPRSAKSSKFTNAFNNLPGTVRTDLLNMSLRDYIDNVLRKIPVTAKLHDTLNKHKENVAIIGCRSHDNQFIWGGTTFLLTKDLALTCYHVIKDLKKSYNTDIFHIFFNYNEEPLSDRQYSAQAEILLSCEERDFTFLKINNYNPSFGKSPSGLFPYVAHPPRRGAVSIIGHPGGECKKLDAMCSVIEYRDRQAAISNTILSNPAFLHLFTRYSYMEMTDRDNITYDTCMYHGASGAPVFNDEGMLVAMHTGGYDIKTGGKKKSLLEYGRNINDIIRYGIEHNEEIKDKLKNFKAIFEKNSPNNTPKQKNNQLTEDSDSAMDTTHQDLATTSQ